MRDFRLIAGPCALEDDAINLQIAHEVKRVGALYGLRTFFKGSYDKANRSDGRSPRGLGLGLGIAALSAVKNAVGLPIVTDVHEAAQAEVVAVVADVLQVPALLSRQTDLIRACAETGRIVNIKRGQQMTLDELMHAADKARAGTDGKNVWLTERGTTRFPGDVVVDMRDLSTVPMIFDATHTVLDPTHTAPLALAAVAAGARGLYVEVHPRPLEAPSDSKRMLPLIALEALVGRVMRVREAVA